VLSFDEMWTFLTEQGLHSFDELDLPEGFEPRTLPFVYVFGRADFTVSYYGANIYPENVTVGLEQAEVIQWVTGKFVLETQEDDKGDKYLHIMVELLPNSAAEAGLSSVIASSIRNQLLRLNSEFANYTPAERQLPLITLCSFADTEYFPVGVKHRYTRK
jgi:phenylacetate-CoA ligase